MKLTFPQYDWLQAQVQCARTGTGHYANENGYNCLVPERLLRKGLLRVGRDILGPVYEVTELGFKVCDDLAKKYEKLYVGVYPPWETVPEATQETT